MENVPSVVRDVLDKRSSLERHICELGEWAEAILNHSPVAVAEATRVDNILNEIDRELRELVEIKLTSGFFRDILEVAPEARHTVDVLMKDHDKLLSDLVEMRNQLSQTDHHPTVRRNLHGWIQRFREFDSREMTLLQKVWSVDVGAAD